LLEPLDRATEQVENANLALNRSFFWAKRLPLFANWQVEALWYDMLVMPDTQRMLASVETMSQAIAIVPERMKMVNATVSNAQDTARDLVDRIFHRVLVVLIVALCGTFLIMKWRASRKEAKS
jgi:membrane-anchored protein YejM (alkaline phosphatase superfamily)